MYSSAAEYINNEGRYKELNRKILNPDVSDSESKEENDKKESSDEDSKYCYGGKERRYNSR